MGAVELSGEHSAMTLPWKWNMGLMMAKKVETIIANSAYDPDNIVAPREYWFSEDELTAWYDDRKELAKTEHAGS